MTKIKEQVIEIIQEIPDDKLIHILEIAKGLKILYGEEVKKTTLNEPQPTAMGIFNKYANPELISKENVES